MFDCLQPIFAISPAELPGQLWQVFYHVVFPVLLLAGIGFVLQRVVGLDMVTLTRLNFYFVIPALIYFSLLTSDVSAGDVGVVVGFAVALLVAMSLISYLVLRLRGVLRDSRSAGMMTVIFYNSGNFGLPVQELAFSPFDLGAWAMGRQVFVMITQNFATFTYGVFLAAAGRTDRHWKDNLLHIAKFPPMYAIAAALATLGIRRVLGDAAPTVAGALEPFWQVVVYVKESFLAIALCTLGAQLALVTRRGRRYPVRITVLLRLLVAPAVALGIIYAFGVTGYLAQMLLIASCSPTAVNSMLMCLEFDNNPDFAAKSVFYSTLLSPITVTLVIFLAQSDLLPGFAPGG
ncbi:MAG: AEC family transporter [Planctomycetota bacterium]